MLSRVQLFATPWTVAHQVPLSMGFSRQEYWSALLFFSPGENKISPDPGIESMSPALQADSLLSAIKEAPRSPQILVCREGIKFIFKVCFFKMSEMKVARQSVLVV